MMNTFQMCMPAEIRGMLASYAAMSGRRLLAEMTAEQFTASFGCLTTDEIAEYNNLVAGAGDQHAALCGNVELDAATATMLIDSIDIPAVVGGQLCQARTMPFVYAAALHSPDRDCFQKAVQLVTEAPRVQEPGASFRCAKGVQGRRCRRHRCC